MEICIKKLYIWYSQYISENGTKTKAPSTRVRFCLKTEIVFAGLAYRPKVSGENGHRKRIFSKTLPTVKIFENAGHSFIRVGGRKERFSNTMMSYIIYL